MPSASHHKAPHSETRDQLRYVRLCTAHPARSSPCSPTRKRRIDPNVWTSHKERIKTARVTCGLRGTRSIVRNKRGGILRVSCDPLATRIYSWKCGRVRATFLCESPTKPGSFPVSKRRNDALFPMCGHRARNTSNLHTWSVGHDKRVPSCTTNAVTSYARAVASLSRCSTLGRAGEPTPIKPAPPLRPATEGEECIETTRVICGLRQTRWIMRN